MSVEARQLMMDEWTRWQGHIVNGVYPLGRVLGCSEHSGVFLTRSDTPGQREVAIKLIPASLPQVEMQLPRWEKAGALAHPHLLPLLESGTCQLDGLTYLYVVMAYADQTLAQVLLQRALTAEEVREMLLPMLDALAFLHRQGLVLGRLKPTNVLVIADQLKLASDTIRSGDEDTPGVEAPTEYDSPEARTSTAVDIWGLGVTLFEALTRRLPPNPAGHRNALLLPADFSPEFRDVVSSCLRPIPQDRPDVIELVTWAEGQSAKSMPAAITEAATSAQTRPRTPKSEPPRTAPSTVIPKARTAAALSRSQASIAAIAVAALVVALAWTAVPLFWSHRSVDTLAANASGESPSQIPGAALPATAPRPANPYTSAPPDVGAGDAKSPFALHEVLPNVSQSAARTIRGHIKVSVRATVSADGTVTAVAVDPSDASGYFRRLAEQAARQWTFVAAHSAPPRPMQIQFDFTRDRTTAHAVPIR